MNFSVKRLLVAAGAAGISAVAPVTQGLAWVDWCETDPPVHVITPAGHALEINNFLGTTKANSHLLKQAVVFGYAEPAGPGQSLVHVLVYLPHGGSAYVHVRSQTARFDQSSEADGSWGRLLELELYVPVE